MGAGEEGIHATPDERIHGHKSKRGSIGTIGADKKKAARPPARQRRRRFNPFNL